MRRTMLRHEGRKPMTPKFVTILLGCLLLAASLCWSQGSTAAINGQVTDASGAVIPAAAVTAKGLDRATAWPTQTDNAGYYSFPRPPIRNYENRVEAKGLPTAISRPVTLRLGQLAMI